MKKTKNAPAGVGERAYDEFNRIMREKNYSVKQTAAFLNIQPEVVRGWEFLGHAPSALSLCCMVAGGADVNYILTGKHSESFVVHSYWDIEGDDAICPNCGCKPEIDCFHTDGYDVVCMNWDDTKPKYCPNCGARMDLGDVKHETD